MNLQRVMDFNNERDVRVVSFEIDSFLNEVFDEYNERMQQELHPSRKSFSIYLREYSYDENDGSFDAAITVEDDKNKTVRYEFFSISEEFSRLAIQKIILALKGRYLDIDIAGEALSELQGILLADEDDLERLDSLLQKMENIDAKIEDLKKRYPLFNGLIEKVGNFLFRRIESKWTNIIEG